MSLSDCSNGGKSPQCVAVCYSVLQCVAACCSQTVDIVYRGDMAWTRSMCK